ncbi:MAG: PqqD family protein [Nitrospira sp.]|nr:PqqD family protein [Nitrospira sp.]
MSSSVGPRPSSLDPDPAARCDYEREENPWKARDIFGILRAMSSSPVYAKHSDFVQREVAGECILVPIRRNLAEANSIYVLNETGAVFWNSIDGIRSALSIEHEIGGIYDVAEEQLHHDFETLLADLLMIGAIQEAPTHDGSAT